MHVQKHCAVHRVRQKSGNIACPLRASFRPTTTSNALAVDLKLDWITKKKIMEKEQPRKRFVT